VRQSPTMQTLNVALITTGGTIDGADIDRGTSRLESDAAKWLAAQTGVAVSTVALFNKDSREITDADRTALVEAIRSNPSRAVLVTHGTFTIADTGRALKAQLGDTDQSILLVGSWIPFGAESSDAPEQMEFALKILRSGRPGVYIAIDGQLWDPDVTEKREVEPGKFRLVEVPR
jgi:L-asparaginase